jgi:hypothetical protein
MTTNDGMGFMLTPEDDDWPDPDDPRWYDDDDGQEALTAAERNPSLLTR